MDELMAEGIIGKGKGERARLARIPKVAVRDRVVSQKGTVLVLSTWQIKNSDSFITPIVKVMTEMLRGKGYVTRVSALSGEPSLPRILEEELNSDEADGALVFGLYSEATARVIAKKDIQAVHLDFTPSTVSADSVVTDNKAIAGMVMNHLSQLGHKRISFVGHYAAGHPDDDAVELEYYWQRHVNRIGGEGKAGYVSAKKKNLEQVMEEIMGGMPTALFFSNKHITEQAVRLLKHRGLKIPQDISIVTIGGALGEDETRFTAVHIDWYEMTRLAVNRLEEVITGKAKHNVRIAHVGGFADRGSSCPPKQRD